MKMKIVWAIYLIITVITVFVSNSKSIELGKVQGHIPKLTKTVLSSSGTGSVGQRVAGELRCASDNLYYRGRQTGSRGLLPRVREDLVNKVLATVRYSNELADKMIVAIRDGTLDLAIARQLDETREIAETRVVVVEATTTTTELPEPLELLGLGQSAEYPILDEVATAAAAAEVKRPIVTEQKRQVIDKFAKQVVVPEITLSSEEDSGEDNNERRSRRKCFYNRLLEDVARIDGDVGRAAEFLRAYELNVYRRRRRNRNNGAKTN